MRYVAEIPVRLGSKRVPRKNLRLIGDKPLVAYAILACKGSARLAETYVNSESEVLGKLAQEFGVRFYKRRPDLAEDHIVNDQFNYDFLCNIECDALVMVNPVSPLVHSSDIDDAIAMFEREGLDTLISVREEKLHSFFRNQPLNFSADGLLPMTQDIDPLQVCTWTVCIWRSTTFKTHFENKGYAAFSGKLGFFPIDPIRSLKISTEREFRLAEKLVAVSDQQEESTVQYYE